MYVYCLCQRFMRQSLIRSYTRSFNAFAANLTREEKEKLESYEEVVSVFPSTTFHPRTTRSWDFMGFPENVRRNPTVESNTIIGVIDSGIWPESESFSDKGFGPPPKKWKGACKGGKNFTCNNKLIGARYYAANFDYPENSPRDDIGHGSHTASTAARNSVKDASYYNLAKGTARGAVPSARIAAYKVCYPIIGCETPNILAAFDDAIADGVDIITISVGRNVPSSVEHDPISIGSLHASQKGILVIQAGGNKGNKSTIVSVAPWILSVAASNTDKGIVTKVSIGNGTVLTGKAINPFKLKGTSFPLLYGKQITSVCDEEKAQRCDTGCFDKAKVRGKIVLCDSFQGVDEADGSGAVGSVALLEEDVSYVVTFPASGLRQEDMDLMHRYVKSTKSPTVDIWTSEAVKNVAAPIVAAFSSKGPNVILPNILKPDITAPGVEILAALANGDQCYIASGTSMACPHVAGAAAYVKSFHPDWSPSAIKSALMTTTWRMNATEKSLAEFSYGSGHIDPAKAVHPGLVYEISPSDYAQMLFSYGYKRRNITKMFGENNSSSNVLKTAVIDLNYPSMTFQVNTTKSKGKKSTAFSAKFSRTVTNVGRAKSTYKSTVSNISGYNISVNPKVLIFGALHEKKSFEVIISWNFINGTMLSASIEWSDGVHNVRSPIVVYTDNF